MYKLILDAMGGDNAPQAILDGAVAALQEYSDIFIYLGGKQEVIQEHLAGKSYDASRVEIVDAREEIEMAEPPVKAVRTKKDASMVVGMQMAAEGKGDAFITAGSTGAAVAGGTLIVRRAPGVLRPALAPVLPSAKGGVLLIDCGATAECTPEFLLQFAFMGSYYAKKMLGVSNPRVALLNIGAEDSKGTQLQKDAYALLKKAGDAGYVNFIGNIEARGVPMGEADVVVSDGFSGNVLLKGIEGTALFMSGMMKDMFKKNLLTKLAALLCMDGVKAFKKKMDYRETGGPALIGLNKPVIKAHGSSDALAIRNAIRQAIGAVEADVAGTLAANIDHMVVPKEYQHAE